MDRLEEDAPGIGLGHLLSHLRLHTFRAQVADRQREQFLAPVPIGRSSGGVRLQDAPVVAADEQEDVTAVAGQQLVATQDRFGLLRRGDVIEAEATLSFVRLGVLGGDAFQPHSQRPAGGALQGQFANLPGS